MKILYPFLFIVLFIGCSESESLDSNEFYESYSVKRLVLEQSSDFYIEGDKAINFESLALNDLNRILPNIKADIYVNNELITSNEYVPPTSGVFTVEARMPELNLRSPQKKILSVYTADIENLNLSYDAIPYLTTESWSTVGDFFLTGEVQGLGNVDFKISQVIDKNSNKTITTGENITTPGTYEVFAQIETLESNAVKIEVRPKKEYPVIELPLIFHVIGTRNLVTTPNLNSLIDNVNSILFRSFRVNNLENPNKVNIPIQFSLARLDPNGITLSMPGIHTIIDNDSDTSIERLDEIEINNFWDPNHYLNIYVTSGDYSEITGGEFNPGGWANFAPILGFELTGGFNVSKEYDTPFFVGITMNGNLSPATFIHELGHVMNLSHNFEESCAFHGDYLKDTYAYNRLPDRIPADSNCDDFSFLHSNIMDYGGRRTLLTYDQLERIQRVIEYGLSIPTPKNRKKSKFRFKSKPIMPERVHVCI